MKMRGFLEQKEKWNNYILECLLSNTEVFLRTYLLAVITKGKRLGFHPFIPQDSCVTLNRFLSLSESQTSTEGKKKIAWPSGREPQNSQETFQVTTVFLICLVKQKIEESLLKIQRLSMYQSSTFMLVVVCCRKGWKFKLKIVEDSLIELLNAFWSQTRHEVTGVMEPQFLPGNVKWWKLICWENNHTPDTLVFLPESFFPKL